MAHSDVIADHVRFLRITIKQVLVKEANDVVPRIENASRLGLDAKRDVPSRNLLDVGESIGA